MLQVPRVVHMHFGTREFSPSETAGASERRFGFRVKNRFDFAATMKHVAVDEFATVKKLLLAILHFFVVAKTVGVLLVERLLLQGVFVAEVIVSEEEDMKHDLTERHIDDRFIPSLRRARLDTAIQRAQRREQLIAKRIAKRLKHW